MTQHSALDYEEIMVSDKFKELAELAKDATPGKWQIWVDGNRLPRIGPSDSCTLAQLFHNPGVDRRDQNAAYIAAANPATILSLYAQHQQLVREVEALREALAPFAKLLQDHNKNGPGHKPIFGINDCTITLRHLRKAEAALALNQEQESSN